MSMRGADNVAAALEANRQYVEHLASFVQSLEAREVAIMSRIKQIKELKRIEHRASIQAQLAEIIGGSQEPPPSSIIPLEGPRSKKRNREFFVHTTDTKRTCLLWKNTETVFAQLIRRRSHEFKFPTPQKWTLKEREQLQEAIELPLWFRGIRWESIPKHAKLRDRTGHSCFLRHALNVVEAVEAAHPWTEAEDSMVQTLREEALSWHRIAERMAQKFVQRPEVAYFLRYQLHLNPHRQKKWTPEDDAALRAAVETFGAESNVWQLVAETLDGFLPNQCGNRWRYSLCPQVKTGKFTIEEDRRLILALCTEKDRPGGIDWMTVKEYVPERTSIQCRERFQDSLAPDKKNDKFSAEEDAVLRHWVSVSGGRKWSEIAQHLQGRTSDQCRRRWSTLKKAVQE
ncbi:unnamed protein product [Aphanomyces euteiches]